MAIAVVSVIGTLVSRSGYLDAASGLQAYGDIAEAIAAAMDDASVRGVILDIGSRGGEVGGLFDLVEQIQAIREASAKPLWAVANESALSAAYVIASAADRLYVTRTGEVGSIGVVAVLVDRRGLHMQAVDYRVLRASVVLSRGEVRYQPLDVVLGAAIPVDCCGLRL